MTSEVLSNDQLIIDTELSYRTKNGLIGFGITKVSELKTVCIYDLLQIRNFGMKSYKEIQPYLDDNDFPNPKELNAYKECTYWRNFFIKSYLKDFPKDFITIFRGMHTDKLLANPHPLDSIAVAFELERKFINKGIRRVSSFPRTIH
jgi:hypothetical protein